MQLNQMQIGIANMPINLILISGNSSESTLAFVRVAEVKALYDMPATPSGVAAEFFDDVFFIDAVEYQYNHCYAYKGIPSMLAWLKAQRL